MSQANQRRHSVPHYDVLPPEPIRKTTSSKPFVGNLDILDAEFELVVERAPDKTRLNDNQPSKACRRRTALSGAISTATWLIRLAERLLPALSNSAFAGLMAASVVAMFWAVGGFKIL